MTERASERANTSIGELESLRAEGGAREGARSQDAGIMT